MINKLNEIFVPGVDVAVAVAKLVEAFTVKGWKFETKDLTPELAGLADSYLQAVCANAATYLGDREDWLLETRHWRNQDHARVAAINHFIKRHKGGRYALETSPALVPMRPETSSSE